MNMELWYCSAETGQHLLERCEVEDKGHEENINSLFNWVEKMMPLDWRLDDYEQVTFSTSPRDTSYFLAHTENNYKSTNGYEDK